MKARRRLSILACLLATAGCNAIAGTGAASGEYEGPCTRTEKQQLVYGVPQVCRVSIAGDRVTVDAFHPNDKARTAASGTWHCTGKLAGEKVTGTCSRLDGVDVERHCLEDLTYGELSVKKEGDGVKVRVDVTGKRAASRCNDLQVGSQLRGYELEGTLAKAKK